MLDICRGGWIGYIPKNVVEAGGLCLDRLLFRVSIGCRDRSIDRDDARAARSSVHLPRARGYGFGGSKLCTSEQRSTRPLSHLHPCLQRHDAASSDGGCEFLDTYHNGTSYRRAIVSSSNFPA